MSQVYGMCQLCTHGQHQQQPSRYGLLVGSLLGYAHHLPSLPDLTCTARLGQRRPRKTVSHRAHCLNVCKMGQAEEVLSEVRFIHRRPEGRLT